MKSAFHPFCKLLEKIQRERKTGKKIDLLANYLKEIGDGSELTTAARFIGEGAFESLSGKSGSVGSRTSGMAAARFCGIDYDLVFKPCRTATGSNSETIERLMANIPEACRKRSPQPLSLPDVQGFFDELATAGRRGQKEEILWRAWSKMTPVEIKFFLRLLSRGSLRIGLEQRSVIASIAKAFQQDKERVRYVHMITGSIGKTALLARENRLDEARFTLFHPVAFMLASPIENRSVDSIEEYVAEEKFDGFRAQVHVEQDQVQIFSRDLNNITHSFPDIAGFFRNRSMPATVLDGEICLYKEERILPFQLLQKRLGIKKPGVKIIETYPVLFISYDLLFTNGGTAVNRTLTERRSMLESISRKYQIPVTVQRSLNSLDEIEPLFEQALSHGNEGLMLKHKNSLYEYGQRKKSWLKVKKPGGSLDTVVMYAHAGSGRRGGTYSDFTLGISVRNDERYEEEFIPIGKAYGGYTDEELRKLNKRIKELTVDRYGPTLGLRPELVVEIEFDDIRVNKRTKAGFTLRFPRFKAIRWDLGPADADTLKDVERTYARKMEKQPLNQTENPSFRIPGSRNP